MAFSKARRLANLMSAGSNEIPAARRTLGTDSITKAMINDNVIDIARLDVSDGSNGQFLRTNGAGTLSFASVAAADGRAYTDWAIKTGTYTAVDKDQLIANSGSNFTITLPSSPSPGATVIVKNVGAGTVTIARNGSNIEGSAQDGTLESTKGMQIVFVDSTLGWKEL
tara:strand:+ start:1206 stop:1709 length:504 start_codon:yes stop_codon:yes gene_type:complete